MWMSGRRSFGVLAALIVVCLGATDREAAPSASAQGTMSCFLLWESRAGEVRRAPSDACQERVTPASTFAVPHALAALDAGVVSGPGELLPRDWRAAGPESARRSHTLGSALRHSVTWYFQRLAERLGEEREVEYLRRFDYGNMDATSGLTTFWIGGSLAVTPEEQLRFWVRLYEGTLAVDPRAAAIVRVLITHAGRRGRGR